MSGTEATTIVLDTNIFFADFRMIGTAFRVFLSGVPRIGASVYIPAVVFDETCANYMQELRKLISRLQTDAKDWQRFTGKSIYEIPEAANIASETVAYEAYLKDRLKEIGAIFQPYPEVSHAELVQRALTGRLPFRNKDQGYKDALIWETVLFLCRHEATKLYLVTRNKHDFGEGPQPHPHLLADVKRAGLPLDTVSIIPSLEELNQKLIEPRLERLDKMIDRFLKNEVSEFSLSGWAEEHLIGALNEDDWGSSVLDVDPLHLDVSLGWPATITISSVDDVRLLPSSDIVLSATANVKSIIEIERSPEAYHRYPDAREVLEYEPQAEGGTQFGSFDGKVTFSLVLAQDTYEVLSADVNGIASDERVISSRPHPNRSARPPAAP